MNDKKNTSYFKTKEFALLYDSLLKMRFCQFISKIAIYSPTNYGKNE